LNLFTSVPLIEKDEGKNRETVIEIKNANLCLFSTKENFHIKGEEHSKRQLFGFQIPETWVATKMPNKSCSWTFLILLFALCLCQLSQIVKANGNMERSKTEVRDSSSNDPVSLLSNKRHQRSLYGFGPKMLQISRSKIPIELDLLVDDDEIDKTKRFDDYGHMRFGKRGGEEQFDDYGHMRFGRGG